MNEHELQTRQYRKFKSGTLGGHCFSVICRQFACRHCCQHEQCVQKGKKNKCSSLVIAPTYSPEQQRFYNLGSGSWLALAVVPQRKLADVVNALWTRRFAASQTYYPSPQSTTLGLHPVIHIPNYMDYYSLTNTWGMEGWVGRVGWPIADGSTTKWSPVQLAIWRRIEKVRRPRPAFYPLCYAAQHILINNLS